MSAPLAATEWFRRMLFIRRFEETLLEMFSKGLLVGTTHTCIGQEADAVGVIDHLQPGRDVVVSNHRCHGHYIAFTDDPSGLMAEVMGRVGGTCAGRGGSQHLCRDGFYTNGVQGSIVPLASGMALAERERGGGGAVTVFIGDGTLGQGAVYECMNMAALWSLPLLIVVENNQYAQTTPVEIAVAGSIPDRARAFGITAVELDGRDAPAIHAAAGELLSTVRTGAPAVLVIDTYRLRAHSKGDDVRDPAEVAARERTDALAVVSQQLGPAEREGIMAEVESALADCVATAEASPIAVGSAA